jgi:hypothetical protein
MATRYGGLTKTATYDEFLSYLERGGGAGIDIPFPEQVIFSKKPFCMGSIKMLFRRWDLVKD